MGTSKARDVAVAGLVTARRPDLGGGEVTVQVVGGLTVSVAGGVLPATEIGSRKARTLLGLLAVHQGLVPADRVTAAMWAGNPPRTPAANVATVVSRLRAALGTATIIGGPAGYRLGGQVRVDLYEAADLTATAEHGIVDEQPDLAFRAARRAIDLLDRGVVLADRPDSAWAEPARTMHGQLLRRARHATADAALRIGDIRAAQAVAEAATTADAFDEAAFRTLMRVYYAADEPARALVTYQRLRATLATELGVDPAPATRDLHTAILQGGDVSLERRLRHAIGRS
jgi:DNA-binding SARP family transcriptional activator